MKESLFVKEENKGYECKVICGSTTIVLKYYSTSKCRVKWFSHEIKIYCLVRLNFWFLVYKLKATFDVLLALGFDSIFVT